MRFDTLKVIDRVVASHHGEWLSPASASHQSAPNSARGLENNSSSPPPSWPAIESVFGFVTDVIAFAVVVADHSASVVGVADVIAMFCTTFTTPILTQRILLVIATTYFHSASSDAMCASVSCRSRAVRKCHCSTFLQSLNRPSCHTSSTLRALLIPVSTEQVFLHRRSFTFSRSSARSASRCSLSTRIALRCSLSTRFADLLAICQLCCACPAHGEVHFACLAPHKRHFVCPGSPSSRLFWSRSPPDRLFMSDSPLDQPLSRAFCLPMWVHFTSRVQCVVQIKFYSCHCRHSVGTVDHLTRGSKHTATCQRHSATLTEPSLNTAACLSDTRAPAKGVSAFSSRDFN